MKMNARLICGDSVGGGGDSFLCWLFFRLQEALGVLKLSFFCSFHIFLFFLFQSSLDFLLLGVSGTLNGFFSPLTAFIAIHLGVLGVQAMTQIRGANFSDMVLPVAPTLSVSYHACHLLLHVLAYW